jgi:hypothetical protein
VLKRALPKLHNLWLKDLLFTVFTSNKYFFADLEDCLMDRCHWNAELQELHVECVGKYYRQIEWLREIVVDVFWEDLVRAGLHK